MTRCKFLLLLVIVPLFAGARSLQERTAQAEGNPRQELADRSICEGAAQSIKRAIAAGAQDEAERALRDLADKSTGGAQCAAAVLGEVAAAMQAVGRLKEAFDWASKALAYVESYSPESPVRAVSLYVIASVELEQGMTGRARETYRQMQRISGGTPSERSLMHGFGAALAQIEGKWGEVESEYKLAAELLTSCGRDHSADFAGVLTGLATVYVHDGQPSHALLVLDQALMTFENAIDAVPLDRIKVLNLRSTIVGRQHRWREAERDLSEAFSLALRQLQTDPIELEGLAGNYAAVLKKAHRKREAKAVLVWATTLRSGAPVPGQVVDVAELLQTADRKTRGK